MTEQSINLGHVTEVVKSWWTERYYVTPEIDGEFFFDDGEPIYEALSALIENWDCEDNDESSYSVYTRPGGATC